MKNKLFCLCIQWLCIGAFVRNLMFQLYLTVMITVDNNEHEKSQKMFEIEELLIIEIW